MDCYIHDEATSPGLEGKLESVFRRFPMGVFPWFWMLSRHVHRGLCNLQFNDGFQASEDNLTFLSQMYV